MKIFSFLSRASGNDNELPEIYPLSLVCDVFMRADVTATYAKILTDTLERTQGLKKELEPLLWDNCLRSETQDGLVTLLSNAMVLKADLFLVYKADVNVLRLATDEERRQIEKDYKEKAESKVGVFVSFRNFKKTDMLLIYSALEYCILSSLHKSVNIAKAVQIKVNELRSSTSLNDSAIAIAQAQNIATALRCGKDVLIDAKDEITNATPDISPTEKAILFLDSKRSFVLGLPLAYVTGEQTGGLGTTGEGDTRAVERGLKLYFLQIIQPVLKALFGAETEFKSQDFRQMQSGVELLKTFDLVSDEYMSKESKQMIVARVFDLDPEEEKKNLEDEAAEREANGENDLEVDPEADPKQGGFGFGKKPVAKKGAKVDAKNA